MNSDLISREALKEEMNKKAVDLANGGMIFIESINHIIDNAPTIKIPVARWDCYCEGQKVGYEKALSEQPQGKWIPASERLPDNEKEVLIQYGQSMMIGYHMFDFTMYPPEFEDLNETGWYDSEDNFICGSDEVIAWMPLSEPYQKGGAE